MNEKESVIKALQVVFDRNKYVFLKSHMDHCYINTEVLDVENPNSEDFRLKIRATHIEMIKVLPNVSLETFMNFLSKPNFERITQNIDDNGAQIYKHLDYKSPSLFYTYLIYPILWFCTITLLKFPKTRILMKPGHYLTGVTTEKFFTLAKSDILSMKFRNDLDGVHNVFDD